MILRPEILLHPNIPKPLHGVSPREIYGKDWWDKVRKEAYAKNDYHCWSCNIHKNDAKYFRWLEAHEIYKINYCSGEVRFLDICALCHACHNFIHSGRLWSLYNKSEINSDKLRDILIHGFEILKKNGLKMNPFALKIAQRFDEKLYKKYIQYGVLNYGIGFAEWNDWYMLIDGKKYKGKFKNIEEWSDFYH